MAAAVPVVPDGRAVARRGARHRQDAGVPALVQCPQAGHRDRPAPQARHPGGRSLRAPGTQQRGRPPRTPEPGVVASRPSHHRRCFMSMTGAGNRQSPLCNRRVGGEFGAPAGCAGRVPFSPHEEPGTRPVHTQRECRADHSISRRAQADSNHRADAPIEPSLRMIVSNGEWAHRLRDVTAASSPAPSRHADQDQPELAPDQPSGPVRASASWSDADLVPAVQQQVPRYRPG
jgi:hypothetical protein